MSRASDLIERFVKTRARDIEGFETRTTHFRMKPPSVLRDIGALTGMPAKGMAGDTTSLKGETPAAHGLVANAIGEHEHGDEHGDACCADCAASGGSCEVPTPKETPAAPAKKRVPYLFQKRVISPTD